VAYQLIVGYPTVVKDAMPALPGRAAADTITSARVSPGSVPGASGVPLPMAAPLLITAISTRPRPSAMVWPGRFGGTSRCGVVDHRQASGRLAQRPARRLRPTAGRRASRADGLSGDGFHRAGLVRLLPPVPTAIRNASTPINAYNTALLASPTRASRRNARLRTACRARISGRQPVVSTEPRAVQSIIEQPRHRLAPHTTMLTILPGTTITLRGSRPANCSTTFSSASAVTRTVSGSASAVTSTRLRTFPLTCTG